MIVRMRGLPYDCSEQQIREFFAREPESCEVMEKILFVTRNDGRPTGDAFVQFADEETALRALKSKHRDTIGARYVELFRSTNAEVQQVVKRSSEGVQSNRRDCVRLRGLPFEAHVQHVVEFLGEHARNIVYQGVHMVFNSQGHPSGEAFIQMSSEAAASSASQCAHNKFMQIGKKTRYIEVFQCSPEDMHLVMAPSCPPAPQPAVVVPQRPLLPNVSGLPAPAIFWPYPSPPMSPNMLLPGQINQMIVYGIGPTVGVPELIAHFQTPEVVVENVTFTRIAQAGIPGEAIITLRSRSPSDPPIVPLDQYLINKQVSLENFVPVPPALVPQIYTVIPSQ